jgi:putative transposase
MKNRGLKSSYTVAYFKVHHSTCNEAKTTNVLNRKFLRDNPLEAIVTDLTYVRVGKKWNYVCFHFGSVQSRNSRLFLWRT